MRIALVASPFISVPPSHYGGTELFIAQLATGLKEQGFDVVVYANGESKLDVEVRWLYEKGEWPIQGELYASVKDMNHTAWALRDAWDDADIMHVNNVPGISFSRFNGPEFVYTIHHPHRDELTEFYSYYPQVQFVSISRFQQRTETMARIRTIHHGVDMNAYRCLSEKQDYLCFLGRIAPMKGTHLAIEVAKRSGIPLKIAGEVQPIYREYFETQIKPHVDGKFIEYLGPANPEAKNELLGNALAMLFPIQWNEPFGLVMIEAMATGTPVIAFPGGAVEEVIQEGVSGHICGNMDEMVQTIRDLPGKYSPEKVRGYVLRYFSVDRMVRDYAALYREIVPDVREMVSLAENSLSADLTANEFVADEVEGFEDDPEEPQAVA